MCCSPCSRIDRRSSRASAPRFVFPLPKEKQQNVPYFFRDFFSVRFWEKFSPPRFPHGHLLSLWRKIFPFSPVACCDRGLSLSLLSHRDSPSNSSLFPFFIPLHTNTRKVGTDFARFFSPVDSSLPLSLSLVTMTACLPLLMLIFHVTEKRTLTLTLRGALMNGRRSRGFSFL